MLADISGLQMGRGEGGGEYLKDKFNKLATGNQYNCVRGLCRGILEFKKGYQLRTNLGKGEKGDLLAGPYGILCKWQKNNFCQLLNAHGINDVR
jgi:hypothetical protein